MRGKDWSGRYVFSDYMGGQRPSVGEELSQEGEAALSDLGGA